MRRILFMVVALGALVVGAAAWWRRHPRVGTDWVNRVANDWLVREGVVDRSEGELGLIEHVGRVSGTVRTTPIHPVATDDGFRIVVPLGLESQWARNVLAAGHCRLEVGGVVHELDEPMLLLPSEVDGVPPLAGRVMEWLGFRYLRLHRLTEAPGSLHAGQPSAEDVVMAEVPA